MQKWEYLTKRVSPGYLTRALDGYGERGWELVTAFPDGEWIRLIFKRLLEE